MTTLRVGIHHHRDTIMSVCDGNPTLKEYYHCCQYKMVNHIKALVHGLWESLSHTNTKGPRPQSNVTHVYFNSMYTYQGP